MRVIPSSIAIYFLWIIVAHRATAQKIQFSPLQQHKLLWADTVYREATQKKDPLLLAEAYYLYGKTYEGAGDLLTSQRWLLKSLAILEPRGDSFHLCRLYCRLALNEMQLWHYAQTRHYLFRAQGVAYRTKDEKALNLVIGNMIGFYERDWSQGGKKTGVPVPNRDSAAHYLALTNAHFHTLSAKDSVAKLDYYLLVGRKTWTQKKDTNSVAYFEKALKLAIQQNEPTWQFRIMNEMANLYIDMNRPEKAWKVLQEAERFLDKSAFKHGINDRHNLELAYKAYFVSIGDWHNAYKHAEKLYDFERVSFVSDRDGAVTRLSLEYETEKKEALLKAQQQELSLRAENLRVNRWFVWVLSCSLLLVTATSIVFYRLYRKNQRISQHNAELVREQNHRVKNNLQVVSSLLSLQSGRLVDASARSAMEESQLRVETMAILQRHLYDGEGLMMVNLGDFVTQVVDSVTQTYGFDDVQLSFSIQSLELPVGKALPIGLIINELTTNACKYAFPACTSPRLEINFSKSRNLAMLEVNDNGPGMNPLPYTREKTLSGGFGMRLIRIQVEQLYGTFKFFNNNGTSFQMQFKIA
nr:sensor histidine kinase [uncultured Dyadobacter sp.]